MSIKSTIAALFVVAISLPSLASAATFHGEFWKSNINVTSMALADTVMAKSPALATFRSSAIDYPKGATNTISSSKTLATFLGTDAATLSGFADTQLTNSVFRFTGFLDLSGLSTFTVGSDDGFRLMIDGKLVASHVGTRGFARTSVTRNMGTGVTAFELVYFERAGNTGVEFRVNNLLAQAVNAPAPVPLPAGFPLLLAGVGAFGLQRRKRTAA